MTYKAIGSIGKLLTFTAIILAVVVGCKEKTKTVSVTGKDYFPMSVGSYFIYEVDSILHDASQSSIDTSHYLVKDVVIEELVDSANLENFRIERYEMRDTVWLPLYTYTSYSLITSAQSVVNNIREVRMSYPISAIQSWNGNEFNSLQEEIYRYSEIEVPKTVLDIDYSNCVTVLQKEFITQIGEEFREETFAKGVGMIYKFERNLDFQGADGSEMIYKLREYNLK
jgi:hypothetical protein